MIKTTLTKLKKAYSTISFAPRAIRLENNGSFYKLIVSLMRRADKRTYPDKIEEEECERAEVLADLMLAPTKTAAIFYKGLSKPEAFQKSSFLAPSIDNNQREKSTLSKQDDSNQKDLNKPKCDLAEVAESMPKSVAHSTIEPDGQVNKAAKSDTETYNEDIAFGETKNNPPNSLQSAIPDIILDNDNLEDCRVGKTTRPKVLCGIGKENSDSLSHSFKNLENNTGIAKGSNMLKRSPYIRSPIYDGESPSIKFFASYDKTSKPPSTETSTNFDELAKHCLDSPNNKIDERLLKEMKKLGVPQTIPRSETSVIEENIIEMDALRKPRKPVGKTEIDVETRKFEHPPLNYSDEQRLEFEPAEETEDLIVAIQRNTEDNLVLTSKFCNGREPMVDVDKPLLNPFDKRNIKFDDENNDVTALGQLKNTSEPMKTLDSQKTDKPLEFHKLSEKKTNNEVGSESEKIPSTPNKLSMVSEDNVNNVNFTAINKSVDLIPENEQVSIKQSEGIDDNVVTIRSTPIENANTVDYQHKGELSLIEQSETNTDNIIIKSTPVEKPSTIDNQPKTKLDMSIESEKKADNLTMNSTPIQNQNTVEYQPAGESDWSKQIEENADNVTVNYTPEIQEADNFKVADEPHVLPKLSEDKVNPATVNSTPLLNTKGVNFQAEGELEYSSPGILEQSENKAQKTVNREPKRRNLEHFMHDNVPKIPEPLLIFNPEQKYSKQSVDTNQIEFPRTNEGRGTDHHVTCVQNLKSLRIRCNVLPTKNTDEKATISLLVEIDAIKQPKEEFAARPQPDVTYTEDSADIPDLNKIDHITQDKVTLILPAKREKTIEAQADSLPKEKPEMPLSEMLKIVRSRNRAEYCQQLSKNLEHQLVDEVETVTGKCGDKPIKCPPSPPLCPPKKSGCPPPAIPKHRKPACPRPCRPSSPPLCPPPCPKPCGPPGPSPRNPCGSRSSSPRGKKGRNPCCPGAGSSKGGGNPCCPGSSSPKRQNPCKFSTHLPSIMMNSIVSLIHQRVTIAESELAQNHLFTVTKDAYQRFLNGACLNMYGFDFGLDNYESMNSKLARDYAPWVPIPCWPVPKKEAKRPYPCPKGCPIPLPGKNRPPCEPYPCRGFPKRKNSFSIIDLYACWSNPSGRK